MADDSPQHSADLTVAEAANQISDLGSTEAVLAFVAQDERPGVVKAADARLADLAGTAPDPDSIRLASEADERAKPGTPLESGGSGTKRVRTRYPSDRFEHGLAGIPVITAHGVDVAADKVEQLLEVASQHDTQLEEVEA